jgi:hypothetical protein
MRKEVTTMHTNRDKFKEVFGFEPNEKECIAPEIVCIANNSDCRRCPFFDWFGREYKECFKLRGDIGSETK